MERPTAGRMLRESAVIVLSILLAFAIDAAWDRAQERRADRVLLDALVDDFEAIHQRATRGLELAVETNARARSYQTAFDSLESVAVDSLRRWYGAITVPVTVQLETPAYDAAIASGKLDILDVQDLRVALADYVQARHGYEVMMESTRELFMVGPVWALRVKAGSLSSILGGFHPDRLALTEGELRELLASREAYAALEVQFTANTNIERNLRRIIGDTEVILESLRAARAALS